MKLDKLVGERFKERPTDCIIDSHALMIRGGYIKPVSQGIFSSFAVMKRIARKIEQIIREEMDRIDGQEVSFPVVMPASLWQASGRYDAVGPELARFSDRGGTPMLLGMTHEEPAVELAREYGKTYAKYPFMIYQVQTKFRDEARPRAGLIRTREFTMKDGYSYHTTQEDLEKYYERAYEAYERIFKRAGLTENVVSVKSDSGMMGGSVAHEFMLLTPVGEDSIVLCEKCGLAANLEATDCIVKNESNGIKSLEKVATPDKKTIELVCEFLKLPVETSCKAVIYQKINSGELIVLFIRGDIEANETKLVNYIGEPICPATITEDSELVPGYLGPAKHRAILLFDKSLMNIDALCCGANEAGYHFTGFNIARDFGVVEYHDFGKAKEGGICPKCDNESLQVKRGIEIGNIFQLGDKYTKSMDMKFTDENGEQKYPVMGCYGIGVGRLAASVCEAFHDDFGPIWPMSIAPWQVHLCCMRADDKETKVAADKLYAELMDKGIEVIYDDRVVSAGVMFSDADLLGVPLRVIVSPRNLKEGICEVVSRDKTTKDSVKLEEAVKHVCEAVLRRLVPL